MRTLERLYIAGAIDGMDAIVTLISGREVEARHGTIPETIPYAGPLPDELKFWLEAAENQIKVFKKDLDEMRGQQYE